MTPEDLISEARDFHVSFSQQVHPDTLCFNEIVRAQDRLYRILAEVAEAALAEDEVFDEEDIQAAILGTPLTMPDYLKVIMLVVAVPSGLFSVSVAQDERVAGDRTFRARLIGRDLYLNQPTAFQDELPDDMASSLQEYSEFDSATALRLTYVPIPTAPTALNSVLDAPDEAKPYLLGSLVSFLSRRSPAVGPHGPTLVAQAEADMDLVIQMFTSRAANETGWHVSKV
jgi:hypothetical protein